MPDRRGALTRALLAAAMLPSAVLASPVPAVATPGPTPSPGAPSSQGPSPAAAPSIDASVAPARSGVTMSGLVRGPDGRPAAGAPVTVTWDGLVVDRLTSGPDGRWSSQVQLGAGEPAASHQVVVTATVAGRPTSRTLSVTTLAPHSTRIVAVTVTPGTRRPGESVRIAGRLVDEHGKGVADQQVTGSVVSRGYVEAAITGDDGGFAMVAEVPLGTPPGRVSPLLDFAGDPTYRGCRARASVVVKPGAAHPSPSPSATPTMSAVPDGPEAPAPGATLIHPATPAPGTRSTTRPGPDALPWGLKVFLAALAGLGALVGIAVASRDVRSATAEETDHFIG